MREPPSLAPSRRPCSIHPSLFFPHVVGVVFPESGGGRRALRRRLDWQQQRGTGGRQQQREDEDDQEEEEEEESRVLTFIDQPGHEKVRLDCTRATRAEEARPMGSK